MSRILNLFAGPPAYVPRTGWSPLAAALAGLLIFMIAAMAGGVAAHGYARLFNAPIAPGRLPGGSESELIRLLIWLGTLQVVLIGLTLQAAGMYGNKRVDALALQRPAQGRGVYLLALGLMAALAAVYTVLVVLLNPEALVGDLKPFAAMMHSRVWWLTLIVAGVGAPAAEELLFRGFLFSALAKSRIGLWGAAVATTTAWTLLHAGYSPWGLIEVSLIGLFFSWLLVRTGSLWVPMLCHGAYNSFLIVALAFVPLPA